MDFLDLLGVPYHAPGVFFLGTDFLFKSILAFCVVQPKTFPIQTNREYLIFFQILSGFAYS